MKVKKMTESAILPTRGTEYSAGLDLYANLPTDELVIYPHTTEMVGTGIAIEVPIGYFGGIFARSGLATRNGLRPANCVGVVDHDYTGEVIVALHNDCDDSKIISNGDRIAQLVVIPYSNEDIELVDELDKTDRSSGGFGSTGK